MGISKEIDDATILLAEKNQALKIEAKIKTSRNTMEC